MEGSGLGSVLRRLGSWRGLLVLNYHRLARRSAEVRDLGVWSATPEAFDEQLEFLAQEAELIGPGDVAEAVRRPGRHVLLTFDDGYRDCHDVAWPILRSHRATALFFLITGVLDQPRSMAWDEIACMVHRRPRPDFRLPRLRLPDARRDPEALIQALIDHFEGLSPNAVEGFLNQLAEATGSGRCPPDHAHEAWLTWDMVREMQAAGQVFGGHTVSHRLLSGLHREDQFHEIDGCRRRLETELGVPLRYFSYPFGGLWSFNAATHDVLAQCGVEFAFSQYGGYQHPGNWRPYNIRRVAVERWIGPHLFRAGVTAPRFFGRADRGTL